MLKKGDQRMTKTNSSVWAKRLGWEDFSLPLKWIQKKKIGVITSMWHFHSGTVQRATSAELLGKILCLSLKHLPMDWSGFLAGGINISRNVSCVSIPPPSRKITSLWWETNTNGSVEYTSMYMTYASWERTLMAVWRHLHVGDLCIMGQNTNWLKELISEQFFIR